MGQGSARTHSDAWKLSGVAATAKQIVASGTIWQREDGTETASALVLLSANPSRLREQPAQPVRGVIVTDDSSEPVLLTLLLPQHEELADAVGLIVANWRLGQIAEGVFPELDRALILDRVNLQARGHDLAPHLVANIVLDGGEKALPAQGEAGPVVIELEIRVDQIAQRGQIAGVVGCKELLIERFDRAVERGVGAQAIGISNSHVTANQQRDPHQATAKQHTCAFELDISTHNPAGDQKLLAAV